MKRPLFRAIGRLAGMGASALRQTGRHAAASLSASTRRVWHKPSEVYFQISTICNLRCIHCDIWHGRRDPAALTLEEWLGALKTLRRWLGPFKLGFKKGEPFLETKIFRILQEASLLGVRTTCVSSGTLISDRIAGEICSSGLNNLFLSLDGIRAETHDAGRGVVGTHAKVLEAIRRLNRFSGRPKIKINSIVAGHNLSELEPLTRWTADQGLSGISFQALLPLGRDWQYLWPKDLPRLEAAINRLIELKRQGYPVLNTEAHLRAMPRYFADPEAPLSEFDCGTYTALNIHNDGSVYSCNFKAPIGHLRRQSPAEIWTSLETRRRFEEILDCKKHCLLMNCHLRPRFADRVAEYLRGH